MFTNYDKARELMSQIEEGCFETPEAEDAALRKAAIYATLATVDAQRDW